MLRLLCAALLAVALLPVRSHGHGAMHERIAELTRALAVESGDVARRFELATLLQVHGDWAPALAHLDRVEELAPEKFPTLLVRGQALAEGKRWVEARAALDEFIQNEQRHAGARLARAKVLSALGEHALAAEDAAAARALAPEADAEMLRAIAKLHATAGRADDALAALDEARTKFGPIPVFTERAVQIELAHGRADRAVARLDAQLSAVTVAERPPWLAEKARLHTRLSQPTEAARAWQALLDHAAGLPPLERGTPGLAPLIAEAQRALAPAAPPQTFRLAPPIPPPAP